MNIRKAILSSLSVLLMSCTTFVTAQSTRVLFLGNSYTYVNNLDQKLVDLALSLGDTMEIQRNTPGGYTIGHPDGGHLYNETSLAMIAEGNWDYVVLQDQSQFPSIPYFRDNYSYPGTIALNELIKEASPCATTVMFMTWGRKYGGQQCIEDYCSADFVDFFHMQDSLREAYMHMALSVNGCAAPVGVVWGAAISDGDPENLFSGDNSHPSLAGTYLAACTFYATLTNKSPVGSSYTAGLSDDLALFLQQKADSVVLQNPEQWNIIRPDLLAGFEYSTTNYEVNFSDISNFGHEYHWDFGDPESGDNNTSCIQNPSHIFSGQGRFIVSQTVKDDCNYEVYTDTLTIVNTGEFSFSDKRINIYPNPTASTVYIELDGDLDYCSYQIRNSYNQVIAESLITTKSNDIEISFSKDLPSGIYHLVVRTTSGNLFCKKIIKR